MKRRELIKKLEAEGWKLVRIKGSHHIYVKAGAHRPIPVPMHGKDIDDFVAKSILKEMEQ